MLLLIVLFPHAKNFVNLNTRLTVFDFGTTVYNSFDYILKLNTINKIFINYLIKHLFIYKV